MAVLTATGSYPFPFYNSPVRDFYTSSDNRNTIATINILGTVSATQNFNLTNLNICINIATASSLVTIAIKNTTFLTFPGTTINTWNFDFGPIGIPFTGADTATVQMIISGTTAGAICIAQGYFD